MLRRKRRLFVAAELQQSALQSTGFSAVASLGQE
jgi:hypothetical protein